MIKNIIIAILVFLLFWGGTSNWFNWNVETVTEFKTDTITQMITITDTVLIPKPTIVYRDKYTPRKLPLANGIKTYDSRGNELDSISVVLPFNLYKDSKSKDGITLKYEIVTEGYLSSFKYDLFYPETTITNSTTTTHKKNRTFDLMGTVGYGDGPKVGLDFIAKEWGAGVEVEVLTREINVNFKRSILGF